jgi:uncharacterized membrane protein YfhO
MPGWSVTINSKSSNVQDYNNLFQKVSLPKGNSQVNFNYSPPHILAAYFGVVVGLLALAAAYLKDRIWKPNK